MVAKMLVSTVDVRSDADHRLLLGWKLLGADVPNQAAHTQMYCISTLTPLLLRQHGGVSDAANPGSPN